MRCEDRSPVPGYCLRRSGKDNMQPEKRSAAGPTARKMDRGPRRDPTVTRGVTPTLNGQAEQLQTPLAAKHIKNNGQSMG
ncbi:hypothetical protein NDU88_004540 [Pleurodeles waltl]|uniref:Uncharacterized protein n=1 Tax=Pleurodeles waltl TaxID=8319 RepID=A0AAV7WVD6_PLEWA|nr:hypothetical protein NDU88_004540 [Pleurodeles waltl]